MSNKLHGHSGRRLSWAVVLPVAIGLIALTLVIWRFVYPH